MLIDIYDVDGGLVMGYLFVSVDRMVVICVYGVVYGVWKEIMRRVEGGSEVM